MKKMADDLIGNHIILLCFVKKCCILGNSVQSMGLSLDFVFCFLLWISEIFLLMDSSG